MDSLSPNTVLTSHCSTYLDDNRLDNLKDLGFSQESKNKQEAPQMLFRRQEGKAWVVIGRKPSGKVKGYLERADGERERLVLKGVPDRLKAEHIGNAKASLNNSRISFSDRQIDVFSGLKGGVIHDSLCSAIEKGDLLKFEHYLENIDDVNIKSTLGRTPLQWAVSKDRKEMVIKLLGKGADVNVRYSFDNSTLLHEATKGGFIEILEILIKKDKDKLLNAKDVHNRTPLHWAIEKGHEKVVELLLQNDADIKIQTTAKEKTLIEFFTVSVRDGFYVEKSKFSKIFELLLKREPAFQSMFIGHQPLLNWAVQNSFWSEAILILENNTQRVKETLNFADTQGRTILHQSVREKGELFIIKLLEKNPGLVNLGDKDGLTPLHCAVEEGHEKVVELLLKNNANIYAKTIRNDLLPVEYIQSKRNSINPSAREEIFRLIINHDLNFKKTLIKGKSLACWAMSEGFEKEAFLLVQEEDANFNFITENGWTLLHWAVQNNLVSVVRELLIKADKADIQTKERWNTNLHLAIEKECTEIFKLLLDENLEHRLDVNLKDQGNAPLHLAAKQGLSEFVKALIKKGAEVNVTDKDGLTPLYWAARNGHLGLLIKFLEHGAQINGQDKQGLTPFYWFIKHLTEFDADSDYRRNFLPLNEENSQLFINFLELETNINVKDEEGLTPLHLFIKGLLNEANRRGSYFFDELHSNIRNQALQKLQYRCFEKLLEKGADVNARDNRESTPLNLLISYLATAEKMGHFRNRGNEQSPHSTLEKYFKRLLEAGADFDPNDKDVSSLRELAIIRHDAGITKLLNKRKANVKTLDLSNTPNLDKQGLANVLSNKLISIKLKGCLELTDKSLEYIVQNCPNLEELDLSACTSITDEGINSILDCHKLNLKKIALDNHPGIKLETLKKLYSKNIEFSTKGCEQLKNQCLTVLEEHKDSIKVLTLLNNEEMISGSEDNTIKIWDMQNETVISNLLGHSDWISACIQLRDGRIASSSFDGTVKLWKKSNERSQEWEFQDIVNEPKKLIHCCTEFKQNHLALGTYEGLKLLNIITHEQTVLLGHKGPVYSCVTWDDDHLISCSQDCKLKVWNVDKQECVATLEDHGAPVYHVIKLNDNRRLASASLDGTLKI